MEVDPADGDGVQLSEDNDVHDLRGDVAQEQEEEGNIIS